MPAHKNATRRTGASSRRRAPRTAADGPAAALIANLNAVVQENATLRKQNEKLIALLSRIGGLVADVASPALANGRRTRGRRVSLAAPAEVVSAAATTAAPKTRKRKPITDPAVIEKRRAALAKAREVRAANRAAAAKR